MSFQNESFWREKGISFVKATEADADKIFSYLLENFFEDEPVLRSSMMADQSTWMYNAFYKSLLKDLFVTKSLKQDVSILAINDENEILGEKKSQLIIQTANATCCLRLKTRLCC